MVLLMTQLTNYEPISVAARSKGWDCGRYLAVIAGSNLAGAWIFVCCECWMCCQVEVST
jgi:hypothetical protein